MLGEPDFAEGREGGEFEEGLGRADAEHGDWLVGAGVFEAVGLEPALEDSGGEALVGEGFGGFADGAVGIAFLEAAGYDAVYGGAGDDSEVPAAGDCSGEAPAGNCDPHAALNEAWQRGLGQICYHGAETVGRGTLIQ